MDICKPYCHGRTALHESATGGAINSVELLLSLGVNVNQADSFGTTPVIEACRHGCLDILFRLLEAGANIFAVNLAGRTAIHYAAEGGHEDVLQILVARGADINCCDKLGWTPLHCAVAECRVDMTQALVTNGAAIDKKTDAGKTALNLAVERGHVKLSRYLLELEDCKTTLDVGENAALADYTDYLLNPMEIHFDSWRWHDSVEGLWLDSPIKVKVKEKWWSTNFIQELSRWSRLNHPHVVKMYGMCYGEGVDDLFFVYERPTYGSLLECFKSSSNNMFATLWDKLYEGALGLQHLHDRKIVHGDLRCDSIVIAANGVAKLRNLGSEDSTSDDRLQWTAPEVLSGFPLSFQSDVFAFGITIVEAIKNGQNLWDGNESSALREAILSGQLPPKPTNMTSDQWHLVERMCSYNPQNRITASDVVRELEIFTREYEMFEEYKIGWDTFSSRLNPREVRDVITKKFSTALTIPSLLADIGKMCRPTTDMDRMNRDVYERLVDVLISLN